MSTHKGYVLVKRLRTNKQIDDVYGVTGWARRDGFGDIPELIEQAVENIKQALRAEVSTYMPDKREVSKHHQLAVALEELTEYYAHAKIYTPHENRKDAEFFKSPCIAKDM